jgi:hypothetical protein
MAHTAYTTIAATLFVFVLCTAEVAAGNVPEQENIAQKLYSCYIYKDVRMRHTKLLCLKYTRCA